MSFKESMQKYIEENKTNVAETPATNSPIINIRKIDSMEGNRFKDATERYLQQKRQKAFDEGTRNYEESMKPKGTMRELWDVAKNVPKSAVSWTKNAVKNPLQTSQAGLLGLMDAGPVIINTASWLGRSILDSVYGKNENVPEFRLPRPSETVADYLNWGDELRATSEGAMQFAGYELGQAGVLKVMGLDKTSKINAFATKYGMTADEAAATLSRNPNLAKEVFNLTTKEATKVNILGDVIGGQATSESTDLKERATQAIFDGTFGTVQAVGGKLFRSFKERPKVDITTPKVEGDMPKVDGETPKTSVEQPKTEPVKVDGEVVEIRGGEKPSPDAPERPKTAYVAKDNLGVDSRGKKVMATTEVDTKTGDAIVYYLKELDDNPTMRDMVLDFEEPHILDKRLGITGDSFTPTLGNPGGNVSVIERALGTFAKKLGQPIDEVAVQLKNDIQKIAKNNKVITEQFADAYGIFKNKPEIVREKAPTLAKFFDHQLVEPRFSKQVTTEATLAKEFPEIAKLKKLGEDNTKKVREDTMSGLREDKRLSNPKALQRAKDAGVIPQDATPDTVVPIYRAADSDTINIADAVTTVEKRAESYLTRRINSKKLMATAKIGDLVEGDGLLGEYIYAPKQKKVSKKPENKFTKTDLDTGKRVEGKPSVNLDAIDAPADVEKLFNQMDVKENNFKSQRVSKTNEDLKDLARMTGLTADELVDLAPGSIANAETLVAARQLVLNKTANLANKLKGINLETATLAQKADVRDTFLELISMQKSVAGLRTEASNVLRSFGVKLRPGENIAVDELITNMKKLGLADIDPNDINALTDAAGKVAKDIELSFKKKLGKGALQTWYASILSGPKTTVRNVLSTTANIMSEMTSKVFNPKEWKEIIPAFNGLVKGWKESAEPDGLKKIFTLQSVDPVTGKFFDDNVIDTARVFTGPFEKFGQLVEIPGRILNRQDVRFKAAAAEMEKASLAVYKPEITEAVADAISESYGTSVVYRGAPKGRYIEGLAEMSLTFLKKVPEGRLIIPFVQTVANVMDRQFDYIPLTAALRLSDATLERQVARIAKDFNITNELEKQLIKTRLRDQQIGRLSMGLAMTAGAVAMAKNGMISGSGPSNYSERVQLQRTGWRPNSIKIGDTWVPYMYLGPLAGILALSGNIHDKIVYENASNSDITDLVAKGMLGWVRTQLDSSFLSGASDLMDVITNRKRWRDYRDEFLVSHTPIPQAYTQTVDITKNILGNVLGDESFKYQYETRGIIPKLRKNLGLTGDIGIADALNPRYDQFGEPMTSDLIWGVTPSQDKRDAMAIDNFLLNNEVVVSLPVYTREYTTPSGEKRKLTETEFNKYVKKSGREIYRTLSDVLPSLEGMPKDVVQKEVKSIVSKIREQARNEIFYQD